jgi:MFS transporter, FHS family, L-fucose permease
MNEITDSNNTVDSSNSNIEKKTNYPALVTLTTVFFFWGFIAAGNQIMIPFCKDYFQLDQFQSQLIDFAFYFAYYIGGLILFILGAGFHKDLIAMWGYKKSIVIGLLVSAVGSGIIIFFVGNESYNGMLVGWFVLAAGFAIQQTAANPFMISLGEEKSGAVRINFGGAVNSLGTTIGPLIVAYLLFGSLTSTEDEKKQILGISSVNYLYAGVCVLFLLSASLFVFFKSVPAGKFENTTRLGSANKAIKMLLILTTSISLSLGLVIGSYTKLEQKQVERLTAENVEKKGKVIEHIKNEKLSKKDSIQQLLRLQKEPSFSNNEKVIKKISKQLDQARLPWLSVGILATVLCILLSIGLSRKNTEGWGALQYPQVSLGMLAIFAYVGVEVAVGSNLPEYLKSLRTLGITDKQVATYVAMYWGSLMIGRWTGAVSIFKMREQIKMLLKVIVPLLTLGFILLIFWLKGEQISQFTWYFLCVIIQITASIFSKDRPAITIKLFGSLGTISLLIGLMSGGMVSVYAFLSAGLFCSMLWPCIFSLSLSGTGSYQAQASSLLIMMILGGALIPPFQGKISDIIGIHSSYYVGVVCFLYIVFFGFFINRYLKKRNLALD